MSGIVGFVNLHGEPAAVGVLEGMLRPLRIASPDGVGTRISGAVALGHAALATSRGRKTAQQPLTLGDGSWVAADSCLCGKPELARRLRSAGVEANRDAQDSELMLLAYRAFGDDFARHLVGDFAVAIWDEARQSLVCARDHLGVRPLYYALIDEAFLFGSDIDALIAHPRADRELNECYLADFLLFGSSVEPGASAYTRIRRLPAAHTLVFGAAGLEVQRYWSPPLHRAVRHPDPADYTRHFATLFEQAVTERMPDGPVALDLSGGMDSSAIAAVATARGRQAGCPVTAYTDTCHQLIPEDREGQYAERIAAQLGIPVQFFASEDYPLFAGFDDPRLRTAEPFANPGVFQHFDKAQRILASGCRVMLTGQMGDTLFAGSITWLPQLLRTGRIWRFFREARDHRKHSGSLRGTGLRSFLKSLLKPAGGGDPWQPELPDWINPDFAARTDLWQRWRNIWRMWNDLNDTHGQLSRPWFSQFFESYHAVRMPLEMRHPFSDIRLVEFMLGIPGHLHANKRILRDAMQGKLPDVILSRPKEGLPGDLRLAKMQAGLVCAVPPLESISGYVDLQRYGEAYRRFLDIGSSDTTWSSWLVNGPVALAHWINNNRAHEGMDI